MRTCPSCGYVDDTDDPDAACPSPGCDVPGGRRLVPVVAPRIPKRALTPILGVGVLALAVVTALVAANNDPKARMHAGLLPTTPAPVVSSPSSVDSGSARTTPPVASPAAPRSSRPRVSPSVAPADGPTIAVWQSSDDVTIPDGSSEANSVITVTGRQGNAPTNLVVWVDVKHKVLTDLVVDLIGPSGRAFSLPVSKWGIDLNTRFMVDASSEPCSGTWRLRVRDLKGDGSVGYLDNWSVDFS